MILLDAYALIAYFRGEAAAAEVGVLLLGDEPVVLTAVGLAEVFDRMVRLVEVDADSVALDLAELGVVDPVPVDASIAIAAGQLRARHYHRTLCAVSMADCVLVAAGLSLAAAVATSDPHLLDVCVAEGVRPMVLPDSTGRRWVPTG